MASLKRRIFILFILCINFDASLSYPEQGVWNYKITGYSDSFQTAVVTKSIYNKGSITTSILCDPLDDSEDRFLNVTWYLRKASCWMENYEHEPVRNSPLAIFKELEKMANTGTIVYATGSQSIPCDGKLVYLSTAAAKFMTRSDVQAEQKRNKAEIDIENDNSFTEKMDEPYALSRRRRESLNQGKIEDLTDSIAVTMNNSDSQKLLLKHGNARKTPLIHVPVDGIYQFVIGTRIQTFNKSYNADLQIEIYSDYGYLSAADFPLLVFYSTMCVIYVLYGVGWLIVSFMRWRELLRVQYWIGAVILLGMLEKAIFTAEYENVNENGISYRGMIVFAELVSCAKRTLSRMLIIIVSFGFGIVKPRLGIVLHRVIGVGSLYFLLASIEGCMRALRPKINDEVYSRRVLFAIIPLALLESAICWWVFSALVTTTRTLRLRRNTIKLDLFRHFTNTLVFAVVSSVIFMLWSIKYRNFDTCLSDWKQLWVNDAFWHVLFVIILLVIMILWRPTNNNQRFAFSPLLDEGSEDEEEEKLMSNLGENMKYRSQINSNSSSPKISQSFEDDLKWVEENIPSSLADTGLPILDSDEEILTTRFEISKMQ